MSDSSKIWLKFSKIIEDKKVNFRWESLPSHRFEEFLDFKMKYYVKHELTHVIAGINESPQAIEEYKKIVRKLYKDPAYHTSICCIDDETNKIIGFDSMKLYRRGDIYKDFVEAETPEVQKFYDIVQQLDKLCPVPDILRQFEVDQYFDDRGLAIHPEYRGYRFTTEVAFLRYVVCKRNCVPLTGAWMTSPAVQENSKNEGWETVCEISSRELETTLELKLPRTQKFVYKVKSIML